MVVKPKKGFLVRDPNTSFQPLPEKGKVVPNTKFWRRRIHAGDVIVVEGNNTDKTVKRAVEVPKISQELKKTSKTKQSKTKQSKKK